MKYQKEQWLNKPEEIKLKTIKDELELVTHNGTTKDDLLMMLHYLYDHEVEEVEPETCKWEQANEDFNDYESDCDHAFTFFDGGPIDNGFKYCPYCGKGVETVRFEDRN